jgi:D-amino peptidase
VQVLISVDMEGVAGVVSPDHTNASHKEYERFRRLMTAEANAAIEGALAGGAGQVVVNDSHGPQTNLLAEELNPAAELISGRPKRFVMMEGISREVDAVFLVGYHAASGTGSAVLSHTNTLSVLQASLNGQALGEMGFNAAIAGAHGVPVVLVTGDRAVTEEARALLGEVETVAVKEGLTWSAARCLSPDVAQQKIREAAERALRRQVPPFFVPPPVTLRVSFHVPAQADMATLVPGTRRVDGRTVEWSGEDVPTVYLTYRAMLGVAAQYAGGSR